LLLVKARREEALQKATLTSFFSFRAHGKQEVQQFPWKRCSPCFQWIRLENHWQDCILI